MRIWKMSSLSSSFRKTAQKLSPAAFTVDFSYLTWSPSSLLKPKWLTVAYSFIQTLALP